MADCQAKGKTKKAVKGLSTGLLSFVSFCIIIVVWCVVTYGGLADPVFMPSPTAVLDSLTSMAADGTLLEHRMACTRRV